MSVVITASPMLRNVTRSISRRSRARSCAARIASPMAMIERAGERYATNPDDGSPRSREPSVPRGSMNR